MTFSPKFFDYMKHNCMHMHRRALVLRAIGPTFYEGLPDQILHSQNKGSRREPAVNSHYVVLTVRWKENYCDSSGSLSHDECFITACGLC